MIKTDDDPAAAPEIEINTRLQFALCIALVESILVKDEQYSAMAVCIADDIAEKLKPQQVRTVQLAVQSYICYLGNLPASSGALNRRLS